MLADQHTFRLAPASRYDVREDADGWTVWDKSEDISARTEGVAHTGLSRDEASRIACLLSLADENYQWEARTTPARRDAP
jgi:hypothetical protein